MPPAPTPSDSHFPSSDGATIYLLVTSPRLPVGLLSAAAWDLLRMVPVFAPAKTALGELLTSLEIPVTVARSPLDVGDGDVVWLAEAELPDPQQFARDLSQRQPAPAIEVVYGSWDPPGARLLDAVAVMDRLRSPGGCPWDAKQTHRSLMPYLLEEAYEAYDALDAADPIAVREELGDLLLQVVFHARLAEEAAEAEKWTVDDVAAGLVEKLVTRHPHVFAGQEVSDADEVVTNWEQIKRSEKQRKSALDGVARSQPALSLAAKYLDKVEQFSVPLPETAVPALPEAVAVPDDAEELGDLLFGIVAAARRHGLDAEAALRAAADRFAGQVRAAETAASNHSG